MPNPAYLAAIREAYTSCPSNVVILDTIQFTHPLLSETISLVKDRVGHNFTLEDDSIVSFEAAAFNLVLPAAGDNGIQDLTITVDNSDERITDFVKTVKGSQIPVEVVYRPYRSDDLTTPQLSPPLVLFLRGMGLTVFEASGNASFLDIVNKKFPTDLYTRERFPSLAG